MINVRTRGQHEGRCEDLDANSALGSVEAVRSKATPRAAGEKKSLEAQGRQAASTIVPRTEIQVYLYRVVKIDKCCKQVHY